MMLNGMIAETIAQSAALKLRQKAIADAAPSFEKLTALGY
jgi:hypothetical protein